MKWPLQRPIKNFSEDLFTHLRSLRNIFQTSHFFFFFKMKFKTHDCTLYWNGPKMQKNFILKKWNKVVETTSKEVKIPFSTEVLLLECLNWLQLYLKWLSSSHFSFLVILCTNLAQFYGIKKHWLWIKFSYLYLCYIISNIFIYHKEMFTVKYVLPPPSNDICLEAGP